METIARFEVPEQAHLFRGWLGSRDIAATVLDEHVVQLFWHYSQAIGGVRVVVADEDAERAKTEFEAYRETLRRKPEEIPQAKVWPIVLVASLVFGFPLILFGRRPGR
ncbi:putative signal transducing protein [Haloferula sargassicola]|uniref:DUF2007 domain-containing protein n=1 Tax=Haloferula sargassicola TaxID=490096 RepID=A0ABP9UPL7_9BACT